MGDKIHESVRDCICQKFLTLTFHSPYSECIKLLKLQFKSLFLVCGCKASVSGKQIFPVVL